MNYRHIYHAGSFTDVFKHVLLMSLIKALQRKNKPLCYLETHAGIGHYDLYSDAAQKTKEFADGILKLWESMHLPLPFSLSSYLDMVQQWNHSHGSLLLRYYPGSPCIVNEMLKTGDRMILAELHAEDVLLLKQYFRGNERVAVHHLDGYLSLKAFLPPAEARGLVFIDPSFEKTEEFGTIIKQLQFAKTRWPAATFAVWYPIKEISKVNFFYRELKNSGIREILCCEFKMDDFVLNGASGLRGCGLVIIQPPWQWVEEIQSTLQCLADVLGEHGNASCRSDWLVPE